MEIDPAGVARESNFVHHEDPAPLNPYPLRTTAKATMPKVRRHRPRPPKHVALLIPTHFNPTHFKDRWQAPRRICGVNELERPFVHKGHPVFLRMHVPRPA